MYNTKTSQLIRQRYSCRTFQNRPVSTGDLAILNSFSERLETGPLGNQTHFEILPASVYDPDGQPRLGTYGFIKDPAAYIVGSITDEPGALEDLGYHMELLILKTTELEIGSCWLGGTFTKRSFTRQTPLSAGQTIPAVTALGYPANHKGWLDRATRVFAGADRRLPWQQLFFHGNWDKPFPEDEAGIYGEPLQMVRLAPSASNKQPWRLLFSNGSWHFFLKRDRQYPPPLFKNLLDLADLQRIDIGIAMAHFSLGMAENGSAGEWIRADPGFDLPDAQIEYIVSWKSGPENSEHN